MKKIFLTAIAFSTVFFFACNGGGESSQEGKQDANKEEAHSHSDEHPSGGEHPHSHDDMAKEDMGSSNLLPIPENAKVFFANLEDGATVSSPFTVEFGIEGMEVEPAGELNEGKGHHHIIINDGFIPRGDVVPANETNIHFGKGQTSTELELEPGEYTLTMQFADGAHQSYGEQMAASISVTVE